MDPKYCYPDSNVLVNKLDIRDAETLCKIERNITYGKTLQLLKDSSSIKLMDGFSCLKAIHNYLFGDIYTFAGKVRDVDIAKGNLFCKAIYIDEQAKFIFRKLEKDNFLKGLYKEPFISKLADYMADVNALHPFREGNGRTQRIFFSVLSNKAGYHIDFAAMNKEDLLKADIAGMRGDTQPLKQLLSVHCADLSLELGKLIEAGLADPKDINKFNEIQEQRLGRSIDTVKEFSQDMFYLSQDLTR